MRFEKITKLEKKQNLNLKSHRKKRPNNRKNRGGFEMGGGGGGGGGFFRTPPPLKFSVALKGLGGA